MSKTSRQVESELREIVDAAPLDPVSIPPEKIDASAMMVVISRGLAWCRRFRKPMPTRIYMSVDLLRAALTQFTWYDNDPKEPPKWTVFGITITSVRGWSWTEVGADAPGMRYRWALVDHPDLIREVFGE